MDDRELGQAIERKVWPTKSGYAWPDFTRVAVGRAARALLAKPVATEDDLKKWANENALKYGSLHEMIFAALSHFASPAQSEPKLIDSWSAEGIARHIERLTNLSFVSCCGIADWIMMLVTTPAQKADPDEEARKILATGWPHLKWEEATHTIIEGCRKLASAKKEAGGE